MSGLTLDKEKVSKAVDAAVKVASKSEKKSPLIDEVDVVQLQVCLKKIPPKEKTVKLKLPHSMRKPDLEVCLFVKDLDKEDRDYEPTVRHFQDLFKKRGINSITEIIPLKSLKTEYKPFEAKRNLSNAYDVFLADARIVRLLPTYLGKHFYGKKKTPIQVNLQAKNLVKEVNAALDNSRCQISSKGSSSLAVVANTQMSQEDITENVIASVDQISSNVTGGKANIKQLSVKTGLSMSIPIYMSKGGPQDVTIPREKRDLGIEPEEVTTLFGAKVKVYPNGRIKVIRDGQKEAGETKRRRSSSKKRSQSKKKHQKAKTVKSPKGMKTKKLKS